MRLTPTPDRLETADNVSENMHHMHYITDNTDAAAAADNDRTIMFAQSIQVNRRATTFQHRPHTNTKPLLHSPLTTRNWIQFRHYMRKYLPTHPTKHARALARAIHLHNTFPFASLYFFRCWHTREFTSKNSSNKTLRCRARAYNVHCCCYNFAPEPRYIWLICMHT